MNYFFMAARFYTLYIQKKEARQVNLGMPTFYLSDFLLKLQSNCT